MTLSGEASQTEKLQLKASPLFFLWGLYPDKYSIYLDEIAQEQGARSFGKITIIEGLSFTDWLTSVLTLGLVMPRSIEIEGFARR